MNFQTTLSLIKKVLNYQLFQIGEQHVSLATLIIAIIIVLATLLVSVLLQKGIKRFLTSFGHKDEGTTATVSKLVHYLVMICGIALALEAIGLKISSLFTAGAVLAVGIGFAMQNIAQNFMAGIILLFERSIKHGDIIEIDGHVVKVEKVQIRSTVAKTRDGGDVIIPNGNLVQSMVKNFTLKDSHHRLKATVGVEYGSDMKQVHAVLQKVAENIPWRLKSINPLVFLREFGDSAVVFDVCVWISDPWFVHGRLSELNHNIWDALKADGIIIAFPQMDVHFDNSVIEPIHKLSDFNKV